MRLKFLRRTWRRIPALLLAAGGVAACDPATEEGPSIRPAWTANQEFHLETRYNKVPMRTERGDAGLPIEGTGEEVAGDLDDAWSDPVYWRYQVIDQGYEPAEGDDLYEYAVKGGTTSPLTVIKASLDPELNLGAEIAETDPKVYLVIREDRLRLAGMVFFYTMNDERFEEALTVSDDDMNRSYSRLSQTNLTIIPHFIPPFPIAGEDKDMVLEDGQLVTFANGSDLGVDVIYENSMDDSLIAETWEDGQPWASFSVTPTIESRLLSADEVLDLKGGLEGTLDSHDDPDDQGFVEALRAPLNLNDALTVTNEMIGTHTFEAGTGRKPWAGSWWPQSKGALVFSPEDTGADFTGLVTISHIGKSLFKADAVSLQNLGEELRALRQSNGETSAAYTAKVNEYRTKQNTLTTNMTTFYNAVRTALDGGRIRLEQVGGKWRVKGDANWAVTASITWDNNAFDLELDRLSPLDKFALMQIKNGTTHGTNPYFGGAWELLNHWSPAGSSWWGHCNGWAAAAILTNEPRTTKTVQFGSSNQYSVALSVADQKGLLSESNYSTLSNFFGSRYNEAGDDVTDLTPKAVLQILQTYIGQRGVPLVFDTTATEEVWNFPAWKYELTLTETTTGGAGGTATGLININTAGASELKTLWGISQVRAERIIAYRQTHGPFQTTEEIIQVQGIGRGIYNRIKDKITVTASTNLRKFNGTFRVTFATDGVPEGHVDTNQEVPNGFTETWTFKLEASPAGEIVTSTWDDPNKHPDFAWVPYVNTVRAGQSENPYLEWIDLKRYLGDGVVRE